MNEFADTESERISIGKWLVDYASSKAELSDLDIHHAQGEVVGVAQGRYNRRIERRTEHVFITHYFRSSVNSNLWSPFLFALARISAYVICSFSFNVVVM